MAYPSFASCKRRSLFWLCLPTPLSVVIGARTGAARLPTISCFPHQNRLNQIVDRLAEGGYNFPYYDDLKLDDLTKLTNQDLVISNNPERRIRFF